MNNETRLIVQRGHDGPARRGIWRCAGTEVATPALLGPASLPNLDIVYGAADELHMVDHQAKLIVHQSMLHDDHPNPQEGSEAVILEMIPTLSGVSGMSERLAETTVLEQLRWAEECEPEKRSQLVLRIPRSMGIEGLDRIVSRAHELGVHAAAFEFDGIFSERDLASAVLRSRLPVDWLAIALGRIEPSVVPLLYYLGFDVLDISHAEEASRLHRRLWWNGHEKVSSLSEGRYCSCHACSNAEGSNEPLENILLSHNIDMYRMVVSQALDAASRGLLRWLVESMTHASPGLASLLRRVDSALYSYLEEFSPVVGSGVMPLIGPESYNAPAIKRFRKQLEARYSPPPWKQIVLLLPCSARKPYSESRSHRRFAQAIESALGTARRAIAETIITSPLGVIPRELERIYPVANYDIPVTGDWDAEEISIAADALVSHLRKFPPSVVVVAHVSGGYGDVVRVAESRIKQSIVFTVDAQQSVSTRESLSSLKATLSDLREILRLKGGKDTLVLETLRATADFQFGSGAAALLVPENARFRGKLYHTVTCKVEGEQLFSYIASNGMLSLTLRGAERLSELGRYWVKFDGKEIGGGSLFAVAVTNADPQIRPGDEVIVLNRDDDVVAVGRSEMSGREMCEFDNGRAVSIRHKVK
ncbi:MAG: DUF5591 domain-containing protein [Candidatus Thorarchaeota archaeon]